MTVLREVIAFLGVQVDARQLDVLDQKLTRTEAHVGRALMKADAAISKGLGGRIRDARGRFVGGAREVEAQVVSVTNAADKLQSTLAQKLMRGLSVYGLVQGLRQVLDVTSSVEEEANVLESTFKQNTEGIKAWAAENAKAMGRSEFDLRKYVGQFGAVLGPMLNDLDKTTDISEGLARLSVDVGSFFNMGDEEVMGRLRSGLLGSTEAVDQLGINLREEHLQIVATELGYKKKFRTLSEGEKIMVRYESIMRDTRNVQGDAAKTIGSFANQGKVALAAVQKLAIGLGNMLMPVAKATLTAFAELATKAADGLEFIRRHTEVLTAAVITLGINSGIGAAWWVSANLKVVKSYALLSARVLAAAGVLALIGILVEDLVVMFKGGNSVIGEFAASFVGLKTSEEFVTSLKQSIDALWESTHRALEAVGLLEGQGMTDAQVRDRERSNAVQNGDLQGFLAQRNVNTTSQEQAREQFLQQRKEYLKFYPQLATDEDRKAGLVGEAAAPTEAKQGRTVSTPKGGAGGKSVTVQQTNSVEIKVAPGTSREQQEQIKRIVGDVLDQQNRKAAAAAASEGT